MPLGKPLLDALDRMGNGGLILTRQGEITQMNAAAEQLLADYTGQTRLTFDPRASLRAMMRSAAIHHLDPAADGWFVIKSDGSAALMGLFSRGSTRPISAKAISTLLSDDPTESGAAIAAPLSQYLRIA